MAARSFRSAVFALIISLHAAWLLGPAAGCCMAETFYVDGDSARRGAGTEHEPFNSLHDLQLALMASSHSDITVYLAGTFRGQRLVLEEQYINCNFVQWPGKPQAVVRGDVLVQGVWTEEVPGLRYSIPLIPVVPLKSVVEDWDVRIDEQGRHFGHMYPVPDTDMVERREGSWYFDGGRLHIHATEHENPNTSGRTYAYCIANSGWTLMFPFNCVIDGIDFKLWVDPTLTSGYCVMMATATNCTIRNCEFTDYGTHALGFVAHTCIGNTIDRCIARGGRDNGSTAFVFFCQFGSMFNCSAVDSEAHLYQLLNVSGQPLLTTQGMSADGFFAHTGPTGIITDLEFHRCSAYGYEVRGGFGFSASSNAVMPFDPDDPESYGMRVYDCSLVDGVTNSFSLGSRLAFVRCDFDLTRMAELLPPSLTGFNSQGSCTVLFESCTIAINTAGMLGASCFRLGSHVQYFLRGCSVYDDGAISSGQRNFFRFATTTSSVDASQCVFVHRALQNLSTSNTGVLVPAANQRFDHCWYDNIRPADGYSPNPDFNSLAEFSALIDSKGIYDIDPQFAAAPDDLEGAPGGMLHATVDWLPEVDRLGINDREYSGHFGAHQYGAPAGCPADLDADGQVNGSDIALLLGAWGGVVPGALGDIDGDGVIGGLDLGTLLAAWGRCNEPQPKSTS